MQVRKQQLELDMEQQTGSKSGKEYVKAVYRHPAAAKSLQLCPTVQPHRRQPTRLPHPWDSLSKNTGVGCHFLFQCMKVKSQSEVAQSCLTLSDLMDCSLPGSSIHGIFQAKVLEWGATAFSIASSLGWCRSNYGFALLNFAV